MSAGRKWPPRTESERRRHVNPPTRPHGPGVAQPKAAAAGPLKQPPTAPPVYRPQAAPKVLQRKAVGAQQQNLPAPSRKTPAAPPVYKPQPPARVLQTKQAIVEQPAVAGQRPTPVAPPVYRPEPRRVVQPSMAAAARTQKPPAAPQPAPPRNLAPQPAGHETRAGSRQRVLQAKLPTPAGAAMARGRGAEAGANHAGLKAHTRPFAPNVSARPVAVQLMTARPGGLNLRQPLGVIQRALNDAGRAYLQHIRTNATYGSHAEAHTIAANFGFMTHIFEVRGGVLRLLTAVGAGPARGLSLLWDREAAHYMVLNGGAGLNGQAYNAVAHLAHNPTGDGNCMYEAMYYIRYEGGDGTMGAALAGDAQYRAVRVERMREVAALNLDEDLANILGEELQAHQDDEEIPIESVYAISLLYPTVIKELHKTYPAVTHYLTREKKGGLAFYSRADKSKKGKDLEAMLRDDFKVSDKGMRAAVIAVLERDKNYLPEVKDKSGKDEVEYPFPDIVPRKLYRWCSRDEAATALRTGIIKYGGVHDGIPTTPNFIPKKKAEGGGGVGIVSTDVCLEIDTSLIPEINKKQGNSINKVRAKAGLEYKVLVSIPPGALRDVTNQKKKKK